MRRMLTEKEISDKLKIELNGDDVIINDNVVIKPDGTVEAGKDVIIDGDVKVNGVENLKDKDGNPLTFGGGGLYFHDMTVSLDGKLSKFWGLSTKSTNYTTAEFQADIRTNKFLLQSGIYDLTDLSFKIVSSIIPSGRSIQFYCAQAATLVIETVDIEDITVSADSTTQF